MAIGEVTTRVDTLADGSQVVVTDVPGVLSLSVDGAEVVSSSTDPAEVSAAQEALTNQAAAVDNTSSAN